MKQNIKHYSTGEIFFLYWHGKLQPCGRTIGEIHDYIFKTIYSLLGTR
jgi:hypothetical protein